LIGEAEETLRSLSIMALLWHQRCPTSEAVVECKVDIDLSRNRGCNWRACKWESGESGSHSGARGATVGGERFDLEFVDFLLII
jgi:hypothetical protein